MLGNGIYQRLRRPLHTVVELGRQQKDMIISDIRNFITRSGAPSAGSPGSYERGCTEERQRCHPGAHWRARCDRWRRGYRESQLHCFIPSRGTRHTHTRHNESKFPRAPGRILIMTTFQPPRDARQSPDPQRPRGTASIPFTKGQHDQSRKAPSVMPDTSHNIETPVPPYRGIRQ